MWKLDQGHCRQGCEGFTYFDQSIFGVSGAHVSSVLFKLSGDFVGEGNLSWWWGTRGAHQSSLLNDHFATEDTEIVMV